MAGLVEGRKGWRGCMYIRTNEKFQREKENKFSGNIFPTDLKLLQLIQKENSILAPQMVLLFTKAFVGAQVPIGHGAHVDFRGQPHVFALTIHVV